MTAQYWKSVAVGFENGLVSPVLPHNGRLPGVLFCGLEIAWRNSYIGSPVSALIASAERGLDFLGYHFGPEDLPSPKRP